MSTSPTTPPKPKLFAVLAGDNGEMYLAEATATKVKGKNGTEFTRYKLQEGGEALPASPLMGTAITVSKNPQNYAIHPVTDTRLNANLAQFTHVVANATMNGRPMRLGKITKSFMGGKTLQDIPLGETPLIVTEAELAVIAQDGAKASNVPQRFMGAYKAHITAQETGIERIERFNQADMRRTRAMDAAKAEMDMLAVEAASLHNINDTLRTYQNDHSIGGYIAGQQTQLKARAERLAKQQQASANQYAKLSTMSDPETILTQFGKPEDTQIARAEAEKLLGRPLSTPETQLARNAPAPAPSQGASATPAPDAYDKRLAELQKIADEKRAGLLQASENVESMRMSFNRASTNEQKLWGDAIRAKMQLEKDYTLAQKELAKLQSLDRQHYLKALADNKNQEPDLDVALTQKVLKVLEESPPPNVVAGPAPLRNPVIPTSTSAAGDSGTPEGTGESLLGGGAAGIGALALLGSNPAGWAIAAVAAVAVGYMIYQSKNKKPAPAPETVAANTPASGKAPQGATPAQAQALDPTQNFTAYAQPNGQYAQNPNAHLPNNPQQPGGRAPA